ncbi:hypothetical protein Nepgr_013945 [Nepenthes gracilis]|uniref:Protein TPX2 n=1 Tax=Nepenthes gracilis TaxID=150966 RepID=A0AAD3XPN8_NEPGR|nr:hypothetical protein Nepgr_013945 [Nepenthes gracilis]
MEDPNSIIIDETYEFSAPKFFDFINEETEDEMHKAELWFETASSYAPSPFMLRIKTGRTVQTDNLCDFDDTDKLTKISENSESIKMLSNVTEELTLKSLQNPRMEAESHSLLISAEMRENIDPGVNISEESKKNLSNQDSKSLNSSHHRKAPIDNKPAQVTDERIHKENDRELSGQTPNAKTGPENCAESEVVAEDACTPKLPTASGEEDMALVRSERHQTAKRIASLLKNSSSLTSKNQSRPPSSRAKSSKPPPSAVRRATNLKNSTGTPNLVQENQAIKRQKLDEGRSRQILNIKPQNLPHKSRPGVMSKTSNYCSSTAKTCKDERKIYVREPVAPFVSMAEMTMKFQSSTREMSLPQKSLTHGKPQLTLTRPKEPEFETAQRVRSVKMKSSAELEEEMMAKMPKFKARPLNRKILEAPTLPALPKRVPQPPEFQEFHLETMARANKNAEVSSIISTESSQKNINQWKLQLTEPKTPLLQTSLRARPSKVKSSVEIEHEELEKIPKFKAKPFNKKIFESKGDLGLFCNTKKQVTIPQEFNFALTERILPPPTDLFDKLSLHSEPSHELQIPINTKQNPFHLHTEERGAEKERRLLMEITRKQLEEERARIPKANPYPYTTDYPVIPPKPEPKHCTKPEPFQLESLVRHEEEVQRELEERERREREEAEMRIFKAQPILKEDPIPLPEKERKPLTQVQEFNLHLVHRAMDRAEFDKKVKEKETMYKRYRDEEETAKLVEEEKALKQLRRTLVPHARPVPSFANPFIPQKSCEETTKAKSPNLRVLKRRTQRQKLCGTAATATTGAAAHMR